MNEEIDDSFYAFNQLLVGVLAYYLETGEVFNVSVKTMKDVFEAMKVNGSTPQLSFHMSEDGENMKFGVSLVNIKESE